MNPTKLRMIIEFVRKHTESIENVDDQLSCLGLPELLDLNELRLVRAELQAISEAEAFMNQLRIHNDRWV